MKAKYTPGPWFPVEFDRFHVIKTEPYYDTGHDLLDVEESPNAESNAKLIAAAPDLLEMLIELNDTRPAGSAYWGSDLNTRVELAIKKAID